jgi:hypothetical protein
MKEAVMTLFELRLIALLGLLVVGILGLLTSLALTALRDVVARAETRVARAAAGRLPC